MSRTRTDCQGFHRRDVLRVGVAGLLGMSLPDALRAESLGSPELRTSKPATGVIQIWLAGGPATIDMWDLKPEAPAGDPGRVPSDRHIGPGGRDLRAHAGPGDGHGSLHADPFARPLDQRPRARDDLHGHRESARAGARYPAAGALAARLMPPREGIPPYITLAALRDGVSGTGPGYLGPAFGPLEVEGDPIEGTLQSSRGVASNGFAPGDLESREALRDRFDRGLRALDSTEVMAGLDRFHRQAVEILLSDRVRTALDLSREPAGRARRLRPNDARPGSAGGAAARLRPGPGS